MNALKAMMTVTLVLTVLAVTPEFASPASMVGPYTLQVCASRDSAWKPKGCDTHFATGTKQLYFALFGIPIGDRWDLAVVNVDGKLFNQTPHVVHRTPSVAEATDVSTWPTGTYQVTAFGTSGHTLAQTTFTLDPVSSTPKQ